MVGLKHRSRPLHLIDIGHHGENVAGAGGLDGLGKRGERADVNHGDPSKRSLERPFYRDYRPANEAVKAGLRGAFKRATG